MSRLRLLHRLLFGSAGEPRSAPSADESQLVAAEWARRASDAQLRAARRQIRESETVRRQVDRLSTDLRRAMRGTAGG